MKLKFKPLGDDLPTDKRLKFQGGMHWSESEMVAQLFAFQIYSWNPKKPFNPWGKKA